MFAYCKRVLMRSLALLLPALLLIVLVEGVPRLFTLCQRCLFLWQHPLLMQGATTFIYILAVAVAVVVLAMLFVNSLLLLKALLGRDYEYDNKYRHLG